MWHMVFPFMSFYAAWWKLVWGVCEVKCELRSMWPTHLFLFSRDYPGGLDFLDWVWGGVHDVCDSTCASMSLSGLFCPFSHCNFEWYFLLDQERTLQATWRVIQSSGLAFVECCTSCFHKPTHAVMWGLVTPFLSPFYSWKKWVASSLTTWEKLANCPGPHPNLSLPWHTTLCTEHSGCQPYLCGTLQAHLLFICFFIWVPIQSLQGFARVWWCICKAGGRCHWCHRIDSLGHVILGELSSYWSGRRAVLGE